MVVMSVAMIGSHNHVSHNGVKQFTLCFFSFRGILWHFKTLNLYKR